VKTIAVVLAGGRGTRSADPSKAKLAQVIDGCSLMEWHLRLLEGSRVNEVLVVAGHLGEQVQELCDSLSQSKVKVRVIQEEEQRGTVAALRLAADQTDADRLLVILGDILMSLPIEDFLDRWNVSLKNVAVAVHPSTHPEDSDAVFSSHDGSVLVVPKSEPRESIPNSSSAGLFAITREGLDRYSPARDFGSDVLPLAAANDDLFPYVSSHYLKDTGTPERLEATNIDVATGAFRRRGQLHSRPALFLDRDGVINPALPEVYEAGGYSLLPGVAQAIRTANKRGIPVFVVTNQPGIAKGFMTLGGHEAIRARMDRLLGAEGAFVDDYAYCPHHPESGFEGEISELKITCNCRKPAPGMAQAISQLHDIDLSRSAMVGDSAFDQGLTLSVGMAFFHVSNSCSLEGDHECYVGASEAILRAIETI
jgi:mannose-1-phosphate guanylyltransferase / phosphomannomutase